MNRLNLSKNIYKNFFSSVKNTKNLNKFVNNSNVNKPVVNTIKNKKKHKFDIENESWTKPKQKSQINYSYVTYHLVKNNNTEKNK